MDTPTVTLILGFVGTMATSVIVPIAMRYLDIQERRQQASALRVKLDSDAAELKAHTTKETAKQTEQITGAVEELKSTVNGKMDQMLDAREAKGRADEKANPTP